MIKQMTQTGHVCSASTKPALVEALVDYEVWMASTTRVLMQQRDDERAAVYASRKDRGRA